MAENNQQFDSFEEWANKAHKWLQRHEKYSREPHNCFVAICYDMRGRHCEIGADFMRARDEGTFPVRWIWPDQVAQKMAGLIPA